MKSHVTLLAASLLLFSFSNAQENPATLPAVGDPAPDFTLPYATKDSVASEELKLSSLFGKRNIILAFYPADWSGGCTKEMCTMRDNFNALASLNAEVLPISGDYEYSHHEWAKFHTLPFKLVSDHSHRIARIYGSYNEERGFDSRTVYVIDKAGKIAYIDLKYSSRDMSSFEKLKTALREIK
jgi:glutaredoxin-dependent peroxiredoxin